jgi:outer membrane protein assembly factor BamB
MRSLAPPVASGGEVFLGNSDGQLFSISLSSGKENWKIDLGGQDSRFRDVVGEIAVGNKQVYVARQDGQVYAYSTVQKPTDSLWRESFPTATSTAYRDGTFYLGCVNGDLIAIQATNGRQLWKVALGQSIKSITLGEKAIYIGGSEGRIVALNSINGAKLWFDDVRGVLTQQPVVVDDQIHYATGLKAIYSYKIF